MYAPRLRTSRTASANFREPTQTSAEYSPRLWPATKSGSKPFSASTRETATEQVRIAGCVLAVSLRSSSFPSKQSLEIEKPNALSASSKTPLAVAYLSASSLPMPGYCEACPGNTNATLLMANSSLPPSRGNRSGGELLFDSFVDVRAGEPRGHTDGVFHSIGVRTSMANHAHTAHTQKRGATVLRIVDLLLQAFECPLRKLGADLRKNGAFQRLLQQIEDRNRQTFANLQGNVAHKTVADNYVDAAGEKISPFDVAYKMNRAFLQQRVHFAHHRELQQMLGLRIHIRAHVEQHGNAAPGVGEGSSQRDAIHGLERPENELRRGHDRASIAGADHAI